MPGARSGTDTTDPAVDGGKTAVAWGPTDDGMENDDDDITVPVPRRGGGGGGQGRGGGEAVGLVHEGMVT